MKRKILNRISMLTAIVFMVSIMSVFSFGVNAADLEQISAPKTSVVPGKYDMVPEIKLTSEEKADIYFTTDGSEPIKDEGTTELYSTPFVNPISETDPSLVIKAIAYKEGYEESYVVVFEYIYEALGTKYNTYFGQLHTHTNLSSDAIGEVEDAFSYASKADGVDFLAITDHSNSLDNHDKANINDSAGSVEFARGRAAADNITKDGKFVGIYAYEMSMPTTQTKFGHLNTFNTAGFESRVNEKAYASSSKDKKLNGMNQYYQTLRTAPGSITQFNHPGTTYGDFDDFGFYDSSLDQHVTMIEVGNGQGIVGVKDNPTYGEHDYKRFYEFYTRALDKGWHLAPTNGQDTHYGGWGDSNTARTVVLAEDLTRDNIYDAMRNRRVYSTEDQKLQINYTMNGRPMGYIYPEGTEPKGDSEISVTLKHPNLVNLLGGTVSVVVNYGLKPYSVKIENNPAMGTTLKTEGGITTFTWNVKVSSENSYYFIQVDEPIGPVDLAPVNLTYTYRAVTAPVFLRETKENTFTVVFDSAGGKAVANKTLNGRFMIGALPSTSRTGYTFNGWYTSPTGGLKVIDRYIVMGNTTLYARWTLTKPTKPLSFKGSKVYKKQVKLTWKKTKNATGYVIQRSKYKNKGFKTIKTIKKGTTVKYTNTKLKRKTKYYYKIRAVHTRDGMTVQSAFTTAKLVKTK